MIATNDMSEAHELCDRVAILDRGVLVACDTPAALRDQWSVQPVVDDTRVRGAAALEAAFLAIVGRRALASS
jgi:ABC-2 type transport system ATP-binding protein